MAEEVLSGIRTVFAFSGEKVEIDRYNQRLLKAKEAVNTKGMLTGLGEGIMQLLFYGSCAIAFWYGVKLVLDDRDKVDKEYTPTVLMIVCCMDSDLFFFFQRQNVILWHLLTHLYLITDILRFDCWRWKYWKHVTILGIVCYRMWFSGNNISGDWSHIENWFHVKWGRDAECWRKHCIQSSVLQLSISAGCSGKLRLMKFRAHTHTHTHWFNRSEYFFHE